MREALIYIKSPGDPKDPINIPEATKYLHENTGMFIFEDHTVVMTYSTWLSVPPPIRLAFLIRLVARKCAGKILDPLSYYKRKFLLFLNPKKYSLRSRLNQ